MKNTTKRALRITTISVVIIVLIGVTTFYYLKRDMAKPPGESVMKPILADQIRKMVLERSDSLYNLQFSFFDINTESGKGIIRNLKLVPDSNVYQRLVLAKKAPSSVVTMNIDSVTISHFNFQKTSDGRKLVIDDIVVQNPFVTIDYKLQSYSDSINIKDEKTLLKALKNAMKLSSIQNLTLRNLNLTMINHDNKQERKTSLKNLNITTSGINVITTKKSDSSGEEETAISIQQSRMATPDSLYYLQTKELHFLPSIHQITIDNMELEPRLRSVL